MAAIPKKESTSVGSNNKIPDFVKLYALTQQCEIDEMVDLSTRRKNKISTMQRKNPQFKDEKNKVFSIDDEVLFKSYQSFLKGKTRAESLSRSYGEDDLKTKQDKILDAKKAKRAAKIVKNIKQQGKKGKKIKKEKSRRFTFFGRKEKKIIGDNNKSKTIGSGLRKVGATATTLSSCEKKSIDERPIPQKTRYSVWRKWNNGSMDGICFCCHESLIIESWHCGHIVPRKHGGTVEEENLRPTCRKCNLGMSAMNMYTFMFLRDQPGAELLDRDEGSIALAFAEAQVIGTTEKRLNELVERGKIGKTESKRRLREISSTRANRIERIEKMEEIQKLSKTLLKEK